jgi:transposase-like protein
MTKAEHTRLTALRFKVLQRAREASRSVASTCRPFGISRKTFYTWKRRFDEFRAAGLYDQPRAPHRSPRATRERWSARFCTCGSTITSGRG